MASKGFLGGGAILVAILMALTVFLEWSNNLHYLWAAIVLIWGIMAFSD